MVRHAEKISGELVSTEIYYFSGTGNSLHVAKELQKRIPEATLTPIVHSIKKENNKTGSDTIGFVFPNFCLTIPIPVCEFLKKTDLSSAQYLFAICTRGGSQSEAFQYMNELLNKQGKKLNAQLDINMPWNHPVGKDNHIGMNNEDKVRQLETVLQEKLDSFSSYIITRKDFYPNDAGANFELSAGMRLFDLLVPKSLNFASHRFMYQRLVHFYSDEKCKGCGICQQICLNNKIEIIDGKPVWNKDVKCYACFACINFCPQKAIQVESRFPIQSFTSVHDRYHHKSVTYKDIAGQK